jgi:ATP-binding cassette subfamily F protein 3
MGYFGYSQALYDEPDLLLLDEPTNHLDMESLEWLEKEITTIDAAVILVAHDRWFLESVTTAVLELEGGKGTYFPGTWDTWRKEKAARASAMAKLSERQAADLARLQNFVDRFRYGTKARQAQSKLKQMDRIQRQRVYAPGAGGRTLGFDFLDPPRSGRVVLEVLGLALKAGDKELLHGVDFAIERGEHVALVGPNGAGKTTLLETLLGKRPQEAGKIRTGHDVKTAYFSQHEAELDERGTVLDACVSGTGLKRPQAQALLGRFLFSGADAHDKPVKALSGGERRRLSLAIVVASGANFLVLDEPTNHLDVESREALEEALESFPGTVLLVSHDRALLDAVATRTIAVEGRMVRSYDGGWADVLAKRAEELIPPPPPAKGKEPAKAAAAAKAPPKRRGGKSELDRVEADIAVAEERLATVEAKLAADWSDADLIAAHKRHREELSQLMERWEALFEEAQAAAQQGAGQP